METLELSRAELWFCAHDASALNEARVWTLKNGNGKVFLRAVASRLPPLQDGRRAYEMFVQHENGRGKSAILKHEGTVYWSDEEHADEMRWRSASGGKDAARTERVWRPTSDDRFAVTIRNTGKGTVFGQSENAPFFATTSFEWCGGITSQLFVSWPQSEFETHFARQFEDEDSPLRLAYNWHGWNDDKRTAHVLRCEWGTWDEMKSLAECVLVLAYEPDEEDPDEDPDFDYCIWHILDKANDPLLDKWGEVFRRVFRPMILQEDTPSFMASYVSAVRFLIYPYYPQAEPSAHEKMEALFRLREWALQHAPDEAARLLDFSRWA